MKASIIDGKKISEGILDDLKKRIAVLKKKPGLAVVLVGDDPASVLYTGNKVQACKKIGIISEKFELSKDISEKELLVLIKKLNLNAGIHGILVQLPLPGHIDEKKVMMAVEARKDVDGFHPENLGRLIIGEPNLVSCTALGCLNLIKTTGIELRGRQAVVVGASNIIGKPLSFLLLNNDMTVTICNEFTEDLASHTKKADVLVAAAGVKGLIKKDMVREGAVVIDVGITREGKTIFGDVDFKGVREVAGFITPVPGGVGPMTIACLMENTLKAYDSIVRRI